VEVGNNVTISTNCQVFSREPIGKGKLKIGSGTTIGDNSIIDLSADVNIGENVAFGPNCVLYTHDHDYLEPGLVAPWKGRAKMEEVNIEHGAWIGANVIILPGVRIGRNSIIAAGAVLTNNTPENTLWGGVPARLLKADIYNSDVHYSESTTTH
jgi:acetyltransferase-like isoleucine patch superfamily enzyme